ncbi:unnamed protein product [Didymodactylos carnosus]|uniref:Uncharacterized protein n=1 Tax=Didymodactylos carnosus TaxID=1234261 RepID=A0A815W9Y7_9BILA|nr:unnamed protein product [Didymodactylos carnosus]CAF1542177.1 unnamed protein product [Didymodactylos carnosus]CAF4228971.1 unnamed protein product [Didymodactylos carnosus]CAF4402612.1 unnamed protein product [Didymodactylos carnosus]
MSDNQKQQQGEGHWETHSYSSKTTKVGDQPAQTVGAESAAQGTFDHGKPVVNDSETVKFTDKGHPGTLEYSNQSGGDQKRIQQ